MARRIAPEDAYVHRLRARYGETDQMGRVHHANYVLWMEEARTRMMADLGCAYGELEKRGFGLVVRAVDLRYRAACLFDDEVAIRTWVAELGPASVRIAYSIERGSELICTGSTQLACVDLRSEPPAVKPLPEDVLATFERAPRTQAG
jgi:acyl-CoA thioester hydrolase